MKYIVIVYTNIAVTHVEAGAAIEAAINRGIPAPDPAAIAVRIEAQGPAVAYQTVIFQY